MWGESHEIDTYLVDLLSESLNLNRTFDLIVFEWKSNILFLQVYI